MLRGDWALRQSDAIDEMRNAYLDKLSEGERLNLMRLCVLEELELGLSERALPHPHAGFKQAGRRLGLVFRQAKGDSQQWVRYRLAHAALSGLILDAAYAPVDHVAERRAAAFQFPHGGTAMVVRLAAVGAMDEARELASAMLARPECLLEIGPLMYLRSVLHWTRGLGSRYPMTLEKR